MEIQLQLWLPDSMFHDALVSAPTLCFAQYKTHFGKLILQESYATSWAPPFYKQSFWWTRGGAVCGCNCMGGVFGLLKLINFWSRWRKSPPIIVFFNNMNETTQLQCSGFRNQFPIKNEVVPNQKKISKSHSHSFIPRKICPSLWIWNSLLVDISIHLTINCFREIFILLSAPLDNILTLIHFVLKRLRGLAVYQ